MDDRDQARNALEAIDVAQQSRKMVIEPCHHRSESESTDEADIAICLLRRETDKIKEAPEFVDAEQAVLISNETTTREKAKNVGIPVFTASALSKFLAFNKPRRSLGSGSQPALHTLTAT